MFILILIIIILFHSGFLTGLLLGQMQLKRSNCWRNKLGNDVNEFNNIHGIFLDSNNNVVADTDNHRIQIQLSAQITIPAGSTTGTITFTGINDITEEEDETVIVTPGNVVNATISNSNSITFTITDDDDPPSIEYNVSSDFIEENSSNDVEITGTLSSVSGKDVEIPFTVSGSASSNEYTIMKVL